MRNSRTRRRTPLIARTKTVAEELKEASHGEEARCQQKQNLINNGDLAIKLRIKARACRLTTERKRPENPDAREPRASSSPQQRAATSLVGMATSERYTRLEQHTTSWLIRTDSVRKPTLNNMISFQEI